jgi:hypothetical protein
MIGKSLRYGVHYDDYRENLIIYINLWSSNIYGDQLTSILISYLVKSQNINQDF